MMRDYEPDVSQLLALYQQLEDDIVEDMVRRMMRMGFVSESTAYQAEVLQTAGILYDDVIQMVADRAGTSTQHVKALFEDAGVQTIDIDNSAHEDAGEAPVDIRQDAGMRQVMEAGYKKTLGTMHNLVSTTATATQEAFLRACDRAYMQVSSGAFSYQDAIRAAIKSLADTGAYVMYPTGHKDRIDVAVRRCILTGVGQTSAAVAKTRAEKCGCKYMELTAHGGARPEHARWQGQLVIVDGERTQKTVDGLRVYTLSEIGYGKGDGFKGWNCRHNWHPYYPGLSTPNYTQEEIKKLNEPSIVYAGKKYTEYEVSQMQRAGERKVRAAKRRAIAMQSAMDSAKDDATKEALSGDYTAAALKLKQLEADLRDFCRQTGRRNDTFRQQVHGFGRSEAQRAVQAAKRQQTASQAAGNAVSGHAVEVTPPTPKSNGGTGKTYLPEKISGKSLTSGVDSGIIKGGKYKSKYSVSERAERSKKAKAVCDRVLSELHIDANSTIPDKTVQTASGKEVEIVTTTSLHGKPNSITQTVNKKGGVNRNYYDANGDQFLQISNNGHSNAPEEDKGTYGEHAHDYVIDNTGKRHRKDARELTETERRENSDIL